MPVDGVLAHGLDQLVALGEVLASQELGAGLGKKESRQMRESSKHLRKTNEPEGRGELLRECGAAFC